MTIERLQHLIPDHAKDLRINLGIIAASSSLTPQQAWTIALASAATSRNADVVAAIRGEATGKLSTEALSAALAAASIMGMNNIYYRFLHFMGESREYHQMPARLRMQVLGKPGIDHLDFELACLAASAITGCESCVCAHEKTVRDKGGSTAQVQDAVRIAAVIHGAAIAVETGIAAGAVGSALGRAV